ncbi:MAG TPA: lactate utilization protein [Tepidisphaeraceae bacterium]|nr:lactate utilization protein [Tepidisphaeraceae bacterium]
MRDVIGDVRRALGRSQRLGSAPLPPVLDEPIVRLVHADVGLAELFVAQARKAAMGAELVSADDLLEKLVGFLRQNSCEKVAVPVSRLFENLNLVAGLRQAGLEIRSWADLTADAIYDLDCGITDIFAAVAETGSLVVRPAPDHGRLVSLAPPIHVAIVEPKLIVPDLLDLMEKIAGDSDRPGATLITGPSKTSDIEGNLVTGVHGPGVVQVFVLK